MIRNQVLKYTIGTCTLLSIACSSLTHSSGPVELLDDGVLAVSYHDLSEYIPELVYVEFRNRSQTPILIPMEFCSRRIGDRIIILAGPKCNPVEEYWQVSRRLPGLLWFPYRWGVVGPGRSVIVRAVNSVPENESLVVSAWAARSDQYQAVWRNDDSAEMVRLRDSLRQALRHSCVVYLAVGESMNVYERSRTAFRTIDSQKVDSLVQHLQIVARQGRVPHLTAEEVAYKTIPADVYPQYQDYERILCGAP